MSKPASLEAKIALREALGMQQSIDDTELLCAATVEILAQQAEIEQLRAKVARLDKLTDDLHASKQGAIVEQGKTRDRALVAERKVRALRTAIHVLTDPEE